MHATNAMWPGEKWSDWAMESRWSLPPKFGPCSQALLLLGMGKEHQ